MQKYALPNIDDFAALVHGCYWFSTLDVADAYNNVSVNPEHRYKLTIATWELLLQLFAHGLSI